MITSHKTLSSGNTLVVRTDTEHKGDCSKVLCVTAKPASKEDKVEGTAIVENVIANTKHKGKYEIEWSVAKEKKAHV